MFRALAERMVARPRLHVQLVLQVGRDWRDTRDESEVLRKCADNLSALWVHSRRPEVFFDPRTLSADAAVRAAWHAKCVNADDELAFITPPISPTDGTAQCLKQAC